MTTPSPSEGRVPWTGPIVLGAVVALAMHLLAFFEQGLWIGFACGCTGLPLGLFPAVAAMRRDRLLRPIEGFAVSFISVGIGMAAAALLALPGYRVPPELSREEMRRSFESINEQLAEADRYSPEEVTNAIGFLHGLAQYAPVTTAATVTFFAGVTGLLTVALGRWPDRIEQRRQRGQRGG